MRTIVLTVKIQGMRVLCLILIFSSFSFSQDLLGSVDFEESVQENWYKKAQDEVITTFQDLASQVNQGKITQIKKAFLENDINYLNGAYLYCSAQRGVCREIPQVILELDLITSKLSNSVDCTNSLMFWRQWLANDMEERSKHLTKTAYLKDVEFFNRDIRPQFVQCQKTIGSLLDNKSSFSEFFKERYKEGTIERISVLAAPRVLQVIRDSVPNVFLATGSSAPEQKDKVTKKKKDK